MISSLYRRTFFVFITIDKFPSWLNVSLLGWAKLITDMVVSYLPAPVTAVLMRVPGECDAAAGKLDNYSVVPTPPVRNSCAISRLRRRSLWHIAQFDMVCRDGLGTNLSSILKAHLERKQGFDLGPTVRRLCPLNSINGAWKSAKASQSNCLGNHVGMESYTHLCFTHPRC